MSVLTVQARDDFSWRLRMCGGRDSDPRYSSRVILDYQRGAVLEVDINYLALISAYEELERAILADEDCAKWLRTRKRGRRK